MGATVRYALFPVMVFASVGAGLLGIARGLALPLVIVPIVLLNVAVIALCERLVPFEPSWNRSRGDVGPDILHGLVSNLAAPELYRSAFVVLLAPVAVALRRAAGHTLWPNSAPLWLQLALALLVGELGAYWAHRWAHERQWPWRLHATHHSPERLYWLNAGRDHPLGVLLLFSCQVVPLVVLGVGEELLGAFALFTAVHGLFQHCNVDVRLGPLNWIFSMAELHRWHHSRDLREANNNYGSNLAVWDLVFGTFYLPRERRPPSDVGLHDWPDFPRDYPGQLAVPFRARRRREVEQTR